MELSIGDKAPAFKVQADDGQMVSLHDFQAKKVVLYFYPKDNTPGCTIESKGFRDAVADFKAANTVILGVSKDNIGSHCKFKEKYNLPFPLLADTEAVLCKAYGVLSEKQMFGKKYLGIVRSTFLIDEQGVIQKIWRKVEIRGHVEEVLAAVTSKATQ